MTINYSKSISLNLIISALLLILIFKTGIISGFERIMFVLALAGFASSFFIKENSFGRYVKLAFLNSLFFGFLFTSSFVLYASITDSHAQINLIGFISFFLFFGSVHFFGSVAGIIPKAIIERLRG